MRCFSILNCNFLCLYGSVATCICCLPCSDLDIAACTLARCMLDGIFQHWIRVTIVCSIYFARIRQGLAAFNGYVLAYTCNNRCFIIRTSDNLFAGCRISTVICCCVSALYYLVACTFAGMYILSKTNLNILVTVIRSCQLTCRWYLNTTINSNISRTVGNNRRRIVNYLYIYCV